MPIHLGETVEGKQRVVAEYLRTHDLRRVVVFEPDEHLLPLGPEHTGGVRVDRVPWHEATAFVHFYPLMGRGDAAAKIDERTLLVLSECMRTQDRHELTYNCLRNYLRLTPHRLIFQHLPIVAEPDDVMLLFDLDTDSRWKREPYRPELLAHARWSVRPVALDFRAITVETTAQERDRYRAEKARLFANLGAGDPHTLPRNLLLTAGRPKARWLGANGRSLRAPRLVGRNARLKLDHFDTYEAATRSPRGPYTLVEFCHAFGDMIDLATATDQHAFDVLTTDLAVDRWYLERFTAWAGRVRDVTAVVSALRA